MYDEVGNPLTIGSKELSWLGRQLTQITDGEEEISYAYNGDGQRVSKTVNGTTTEFIYNGDILAGQKTGNDVLVFMYDNNGDAFGFIYNGTEYYYIKNAQNDVTAIASADGTIIANYYYDSWGKLTEITGDTEIAELNPIRYRSYYYDSETEWYYLNTRYYSPELCRFINGDSKIHDDLLGNNLYSYCGNNPITRIDEQGKFWNIVAGAAIGAVVSFVGTAVANVSSGRAWNNGIIGATLGGAVTGAVAGATFGTSLAVAGAIAGAFAGAFVTSAVNEVISYTSFSSYNGTTRNQNTRNNRIKSYIKVGRDTVVNGVISAATGIMAGGAINCSYYVKPITLSESLFSPPALAQHAQTVIGEIIGLILDSICIDDSDNSQEPVWDLYPAEGTEGAAVQ